MPNFLDAPEIFPLPSLQAYSSISLVSLACALYYAFQVTSEPGWNLDKYLSIDGGDDGYRNETNTSTIGFNETIRNAFFKSLFKHQNESLSFNEMFKNPLFLNILNIAYIMVHEPLCVWSLINMCYCLLILFGKFIQRLVFGELRNSEQQLLRDKFWNFLVHKFIFVFSVINVQYMNDLILWCSWFSVLGFMFLLTHLCKERFSYLTYSPTVSRWEHFKLLTLLISILISTIPLFIIGVVFGVHTSFSTGAFLVSEVLILFLRTLHCFTLYLVHIWDLSHDSMWEIRTSIIYYIELTFDLLILLIDFCHHFHMLFWANIFLSVSSLVILIQLREIYTEIVKRIKKHRNYLQVLNLMEENFPMATQDEITDDNSDCAICWDRMENARRLPCNHLFHATCLRSWLEQDTSCPTCRHLLRQREEVNGDVVANDNNNNNNNNRPQQPANNTSFFHFDGQRYARWLPSVSVEVTRPNLIDININTSLTARNEQPLQDFAQQQIEFMGQQVLEWFPQFSLTAILEDIRNTRSVEHTIENILDGRLTQATSTDNNDNNQNSSTNGLENSYSFIFTPEFNGPITEETTGLDSIDGENSGTGGPHQNDDSQHNHQAQSCPDKSDESDD